MYYKIYVDTKYAGSGGITQLINGYVYGGIYLFPSTGEDYWLDNILWYSKNPSQITNLVDWTDNPIAIDDEPGFTCIFSPAGMRYDFKDYVRFKPDGDSDNIFVTLGIITWHVEAEATKVNGVWVQNPNNFVYGPNGPNISNTFPFWDSVFNNSLFQ